MYTTDKRVWKKNHLHQEIWRKVLFIEQKEKELNEVNKLTLSQINLSVFSIFYITEIRKIFVKSNYYIVFFISSI